MKKSLLALAVLGAFAGAASAQSSVTLYGIVDVGVAVRSTSSAAELAAARHRRWTSGRQPRGLSRFGSHWWRSERGLRPGGGLQHRQRHVRSGGRLFGRQAWVGVDGDIGTLVAGRIAIFSSGTGSFDMFGATDPFGTALIFAGLQSTFSSGNSMRLDNAIMYRSPKSPASSAAWLLVRRAAAGPLAKCLARATTTARCSPV